MIGSLPKLIALIIVLLLEIKTFTVRIIYFLDMNIYPKDFDNYIEEIIFSNNIINWIPSY